MEAVQVETVSSQEHWNTYLLEDRSSLKLKPFVTKIYRIKDAYDQEGNPAYFVRSGNVLAANSPEELKRKV